MKIHSIFLDACWFTSIYPDIPASQPRCGGLGRSFFTEQMPTISLWERGSWGLQKYLLGCVLFFKLSLMIQCWEGSWRGGGLMRLEDEMNIQELESSCFQKDDKIRWNDMKCQSRVRAVQHQKQTYLHRQTAHVEASRFTSRVAEALANGEKRRLAKYLKVWHPPAKVLCMFLYFGRCSGLCYTVGRDSAPNI